MSKRKKNKIYHKCGNCGSFFMCKDNCLTHLKDNICYAHCDNCHVVDMIKNDKITDIVAFRRSVNRMLAIRNCYTSNFNINESKLTNMLVAYSL